MADTVTLRNATADDAQAIQRVALASWHKAYDSILGADVVEDTVASWYDPERLVADDIQQGERPFFVADAGDRVVGFVEAAPDETDAGTYHLYRLYLDPDYWGEGIGTALLERVEATLREETVLELRVSVLAENDVGVGFYESNGFERSETVHDEQLHVQRHEYRKEL